MKEPKDDNVNKRKHKNSRACSGSPAERRPMLRSPRRDKHSNKSCSNVICHQRIRFKGAQLPLLLCALRFSVQDLYFSSLLIPLSPPTGIFPVPLISRVQLGNRLFKVSHCALLGLKHREANAGGYASAAQVKLQISSALASVNGFDKAFVAQQRACRHHDLVAVF